MKRFLAWFLITLAIGATVFYYHRAEQERRDSAQHSAQERLRARAEIAAFARAKGALTDWQGGLCRGALYTLDLQNAVLPEGHQPVLLVAWLNDVRRNTGDSSSPAILVFQVELCNDTEVDFELAASNAEVTEALRHRGELADYFAVIAQCTEVTSVPPQPHVTRSDSDGGEDPPRFIVKGFCTDLRFLGFDAPLE